MRSLFTLVNGHPSLYRRLLVSVLGLVLLAAVIQSIVAYRTALNEADTLFDSHMVRIAQSLGSGVLHQQLQANQEVAQDRVTEDFVVQMWTREGVPLFQSAAHRKLRPQGAPGFSLVQTLDGRLFRVFVLHTPEEIVQIAQDMATRREMARLLAVRSVVPGLLMAPVLMGVLWWVVRRSLAPVARVSAEMATRRVDEVSPISDDGLPTEVMPLINELNQLFGRVRRAFEGQQHFVADAAHELRSPLTALKVQLQGLQRAPDAETQARAIGRLSAGLDRLAHLVDQLMVLARQEATLADPRQREVLDLTQIALLALTDVLPSAQQRQVDLGVQETRVTQVRGQADTLRVLVRNLLDNGRKYVPKGGIVDLTVRPEGGQAVLIVEDNGPGIPPEHRDRVWDRFYRLPGSEVDGSGLGLAIVRAVADAHGAHIELGQSERLGGLRVTVRFPELV